MNKKYIVRKNEEIKKIIELKQKKISDYFIIYYQKNNIYNRYCISISKKLGNAVLRNYIKRKIKDILEKNIIKNNLNCVIIVKQTCISLSYDELKKILLNQIGEIR